MRLAVFLLAAIQGVLFVLYALGRPATDPDGATIPQGAVTLAGMVIAIFLVPALILAINRKAPRLSLTLALIPLLAGYIALRFV
ncbi:hypothetical protein N9L47_09045 [Rhodobacteraceae bacterium]|nr:hypothetical protein [Paracoccaceae bacterium]